MVVDLIGIYGLKGPYCTLTTTNWFLQALSVIPRGSWGDVARLFTMIRWAVHIRPSLSSHKPPPPPPPRVAGIRSGQFDEENPFVQNFSVLLVQANKGFSVLVVDRIGDIYRILPRRVDVIVTTVGARHKCQQGSGFEPPMCDVIVLIINASQSMQISLTLPLPSALSPAEILLPVKIWHHIFTFRMVNQIMRRNSSSLTYENFPGERIPLEDFIATAPAATRSDKLCYISDPSFSDVISNGLRCEQTPHRVFQISNLIVFQYYKEVYSDFSHRVEDFESELIRFEYSGYFSNQDLINALNEMVHEYRKLSQTFEEIKDDNNGLKNSSVESSTAQLEDTDSLKIELSKLMIENDLLRNMSCELKSENERLNEVMSSWTKSSVSLSKLHETQKPLNDKSGLGFCIGESSSEGKSTQSDLAYDKFKTMNFVKASVIHNAYESVKYDDHTSGQLNQKGKAAEAPLCPARLPAAPAMGNTDPRTQKQEKNNEANKSAVNNKRASIPRTANQSGKSSVCDIQNTIDASNTNTLMPKAIIRSSIRTSTSDSTSKDLTRARKLQSSQSASSLVSANTAGIAWELKSVKASHFLTSSLNFYNLRPKNLKRTKELSVNCRGNSRTLQILRAPPTRQSSTPDWYQSKELSKTNPAPPVLL
ncbi:disease resistance protein [Dorcoceras hygrometricum]|uniref:Disease resistance protein n=1 Tax=Dorcoceras hygrometricum TaxID=472368 RepID=A0A2Z7D711_9LAMI|nr:disease resistance protein [Dorcoceras hygrometricum]